MRKIHSSLCSILFIAVTTLFVQNGFAQVSVTITGASNTTPNLSASYTSLANAITALNGITAISGPVTLTAATGSETAPAGGYVINFTATTTSANYVVITGTATTTITTPNPQTSGNVNDAIFKIIGSDYVTIQNFTMQEHASNTTTTIGSNNMTEFGVALFYASATNGCQNITIKNNIISLNRTYTNTFGIYANSTHTATAVTTSATATGASGGNHNLTINGNTISNVNQGIVIIGPTAAADVNTGASIGSSSTTGNTISNYGTAAQATGYANVSGTMNGILIRNSKGFTISYNSITSSVGGVTVGTTRGIYQDNSSNTQTGTYTNSINNNTLSVRGGASGVTVQGIISGTTNGTNTSTININNNEFTALNHTSATATTGITAISITSAFLHSSVSNNIFNNLTTNTSGNFTFIINGNSLPTTGTMTIDDNSLTTGFTKSVAGNTVTFFTTNASSVTGSTVSIQDNNFSNISLTGATNFIGIDNTDGASGSAPVKTISGNTFTFNTGTTPSGTINPMTVNFGSNGTVINNNTIGPVSWGAALTALTLGSGLQATTTVSGNTISSVATTMGALIGISSSAPTVNITGNLIHTLSTSGTGAVSGITTGGGTTINIARNKIYNLSGSNASSIVSGIALTTVPTTANISNNLIGDLKATTATADNSVRGINIPTATASRSVNVYYNTIYLNATSSGTNFGTSGISATASTTSTTAQLTLRNNIVVNNSTKNGTGLTVAYRRSAGTADNLNNYNSASNNNLFYAGTPSASNLIYYDGTSSAQTIAAYKSGVFTAGTISPRDQASISENPTFLSTTGSNSNFLHIASTPATQIESGAAEISGFIDDYDATGTRPAGGPFTPNTNGGGTAPDIGADEGDFVPSDITAPTITYTALTNGCDGNRTLTATLTDASGVDNTGTLKPRIYYRKNSGTWYSQQGSLSSGNVSNGTWSFTIVSSDMGTITYNDVISYYVIAQDVAGTPNIGSNPAAGLVATNVNTVTTEPTSPNTYGVGLTGTYTVGASGDFTTLTAAAAAYNARAICGPVVFNLIDASYAMGTATTTFNLNAGASSTNTLTIKPNGGVAAVISGATSAGNPLLDLNGAVYITFDGLNTGGNSLTISNTTVSASSNTSTVRFINGASNNTITNCNVLGSGTMAVGTNGGNIFFSTDGSTANGNDNNTISYCNIGPAGSNLPTKGISGNGTTTTTAIGNSGININNNNFYDIFGAAVASACIYTNGGCNTWSITNNKFYQTGTRTFTSGVNHRVIDINNSSSTSGAQGFTITGNIIGYASSTQTGTYTLTSSSGKFIGINFNGIPGGTNSDINNNTIASVSLTGVTTSGTTSSSPFTAILIQSGVAISNNNTIGSISTSGSLVFSTNSTGSTDIHGILNNGLDAWTSNNNTIGGISVTNTAASGTYLLAGLKASTSSSDSWTATGNTISGNQLTSTGAASQVIGIYAVFPASNLTSNTVRHLSNNNGTGTNSTSSVIGISVAASSANHTVSQNTVHSLASTLAGAANIVGIYYNSSTGTNVIEKNFVHSFSASNTAAVFQGIATGGTSVVTIKNNMVRLGIETNGIMISTALSIEGITKGASGAHNIYFNSVYIGGTLVGTTATNTYAFRRTSNNTSDNVQNNIFSNVRSNNTSGGKHYAYYQNSGGTYTLNYNVYQYSGTGGVFGYNGTADVSAYSGGWYSGDANSQVGDPAFINPTGNSSAVNLHIHATNPSYAEGSGIAIVGIDDDYDGDDRTLVANTPTDIGADAGNFTPFACLAPSAVTASNIGTTTVDIGWTNPSGGSPVNYEWEIRTSGAGGSGSSGLTTSGNVAHPTNSVTGITTNLVSSTSYNIYVRTDCGSGDYSSWVGPVAFTTTLPNDACANATAITPGSTCTPTNGTTVGASQQYAATSCSGSASSSANEVWYSFTADGTSSYQINVSSGASIDMVIGLYSACGTLISCIDDAGNNATETLNAGILSAGTYLYRVYRYNNATGAAFTTCVVYSTPPANNTCATATSLTPFNSSICGGATSGTLVGATNDGGANCSSGGATSGDVWYSFVATSSTHTITVVPNASLDAVFEVYSSGSTCGSLISSNCIDGPSTGGTETANINGFTVGNTYYVRVMDFNSSSTTPTFTICVTSLDPCFNVTTLTSGVPATVTLSGTGFWGNSTTLGCSSYLTPGVEALYQFTPTTTGWYTVRTNAVSSNPFVYYMYKPVSLGCDANNWNCIGTSNDNTPSINISEIYLTGGTSYYILLDNASTSSTTHTFQIAPATPAVLPTGTLFPSDGSTIYIPTNGWNMSGVNPAAAFEDVSFNSEGDALMLHFDSEPYKLIYYLEGATANVGTLRFQESADGLTWSNIVTYTNNAPTTFAFYEHLLNVNSRFVRIYKETHSSNAFVDELAIVKKIDLSCTNAPYSFYDKGGSGGNYGNAEYNVWTIIPQGTGNNVNVQFSSFNLENNFDYLVMRNGNSANSALISSNTGTTNPAQQTSTATDGSLTIYMYSDANTTAAGWTATLNLANSTARTWTGNTNTDWGTAGNWCGGGVPTGTTNVDIPNVTNDPVVAGITATCNNITLQSGATLGVPSATAITVNGAFTNNGTVNVANNGNFIQTTGSTLSGSGTFNVTRNGTSSATVYNYWSTPIASASLGLLGGTNYFYNPANGTADFSDDNPGPDPGWSAASGSFSVGKGYAGQGPNPAVTFTGTANNGTLNQTVQYFTLVNGSTSPGVPYNLIGNPYPSNIDAASFLTANNTKVTGAIYYWDDDNTGGTGYAANDYAIWNGTGSTGGGGRTPNGMIATAQGFFVQTLSGATSVSFTNAMRAATATTFFKTEEVIPQRLWLRADNGTHTNQILVGYVDGATEDMDWFYDAQKLRGNHSVSFYSLLNDTMLLGIQGLTPLNGAEPSPVPLGLYAGATGQYSIYIDSIENFPSNMPINLLDADMGIVYDLRNGPYLFQTAQGEDNDRFVLFPNEIVTAIDELDNLHLNIYPNPNNGAFTLMVNSGVEQQVKISLFDVTGKLVLAADKAISSGNNFIALETQVAGVYMLKVETTDKAYNKRVVAY